jgi:DNA-binding response OmpR family regulator
MSKILIVDDEPHLRLLYETELRRAGYETMTACNAQQGLEFVETMKPDLVILDIRMAGMDGIEALQRILERDSSVPVILNTAFSSYRDNYLTWAADAYITKSADVTELLDTVSGLLKPGIVSGQ